MYKHLNKVNKGTVIPLVDESGDRLPKNVSRQFRDVQSGIEYLKDSSDTIRTELKGVSHKLNNNTTDLATISKKVNEIDADVKELTKTVGESFGVISKSLDGIIKAITKRK